MPVYEYECKECDRVFEVQQKMADEPLSHCPKCRAPIKKLMSMSSFQLRGGGWYADGYSSASAAKSDVNRQGRCRRRQERCRRQAGHTVPGKWQLCQLSGNGIGLIRELYPRRSQFLIPLRGI